MKTIIFFITHKTLTEEHLLMSFHSIRQQKCNKKFDILYIYNTHQNELSNDMIIEYYNEYKLYKFFNEIKIFNYDDNTHKSLGGDISVIRNYCLENYNDNDRVLLLKSDCNLSINYFDEILNIPENYIYFTAPFICAKQRVNNNEIIEYCHRNEVIFSDDITFFVEDSHQSTNNDFFNRKDVNITDEQIKFTSCYVVRDFSCHYISVKLLSLIDIEYKSWGGVNFSNLLSYLITTNKNFVVHKYHGIISDNRKNDREGPVKDWLES